MEIVHNNANGTDTRGEEIVLFYCPGGSKRAVAVARCFAHFLRKHGYEGCEVEHFNIDDGRYPHRRGCAQCNAAWLEELTDRQRLLNFATNTITRIFADEIRVRRRDP